MEIIKYYDFNEPISIEPPLDAEGSLLPGWTILTGEYSSGAAVVSAVQTRPPLPDKTKKGSSNELPLLVHKVNIKGLTFMEKIVKFL